MKFYKDSAGMCVIGDEWYLAPGDIFLRFSGSNVRIELKGVEYKDEDTALYKGPISGLTTSLGVSYSDKATLLSAINTLVTGIGLADVTAIVASITTNTAAIKSYGANRKRSFKAKLTRPANATPYTTGDIIGDVTTLFKEIADVALENNSGVTIFRARIQTNDTGFAGVPIKIQVYCDTPDITGLSDNTAFAISWANAEKRVGEITVLMGTGSKATVGANDYTTLSCNPAARNLYYILEAGAGATPSASSTEWWVILDCELSNN